MFLTPFRGPESPVQSSEEVKVVSLIMGLGGKLAQTTQDDPNPSKTHPKRPKPDLKRPKVTQSDPNSSKTDPNPSKRSGSRVLGDLHPLKVDPEPSRRIQTVCTRVDRLGAPFGMGLGHFWWIQFGT